MTEKQTTRLTKWREYSDHGRCRIRAEYGFEQYGRGRPRFFISGEIEMFNGVLWEPVAFGYLRKELTEYFPELANALRWHGWNETAGPSHYVLGAKRYWKKATRKPDPAALTSFKRHVCFGALKNDVFPTTSTIPTWCTARLPALLKKMRADIAAIDHAKLAPVTTARSRDGWQEFADQLAIEIYTTCLKATAAGANVYDVTLSRVNEGSLKTTVTYYAGDTTGPTAGWVLATLVSEARMGVLKFKEFCRTYRYAANTTYAQRTHRAHQRTSKKLRAFLGESRFKILSSP